MNSPKKSWGVAGPLNIWEKHGYWAVVLVVTVSYTALYFFLFGAIFAGIVASLFAASVWAGIKIVVMAFEQSGLARHYLDSDTERSLPDD